MDRPDQLFGDGQSPSSESEIPSSPALLQEQSTTLPEQRLFKRIMMLTLLLGIMVGCWLTLVGVMLYDFQRNPSDPTINRLIGPLWCIPAGVAFILLGRVQSLRKQHPAFQAGRFDRSSPPLIFGLLWIWLGSSQLIKWWFNLDLVMSYLIVGMLVGSVALVAKQFVSFLSKSRTTQQ